MAVATCDLQKKLELELERLKKVLKLGYELNVRWFLNDNSKLSGEVKGDCIYIYDEDEATALETLKHEFLDYVVSEIIKPYKDVTNKLTKMRIKEKKSLLGL